MSASGYLAMYGSGSFSLRMHHCPSIELICNQHPTLPACSPETSCKIPAPLI